MIIVPENEIAGLIGRSESFEAIEKVFGAMSRGDAYNFPVIRENIGHADAIYGFKSGFDRAGLALGSVCFNQSRPSAASRVVPASTSDLTDRARP